jgi:hypothetical protein
MSLANPPVMSEHHAVALAQGTDYEWFQGHLPMTKWRNDPSTPYCHDPRRFVSRAGEEHPSK